MQCVCVCVGGGGGGGGGGRERGALCGGVGEVLKDPRVLVLGTRVCLGAHPRGARCAH